MLKSKKQQNKNKRKCLHNKESNSHIGHQHGCRFKFFLGGGVGANMAALSSYDLFSVSLSTAAPSQSLVVEPQRQGMQREELETRLTVTQCCLYHFLSDLACLIPSSSSAWMSITAPDTSFSNDFKPSLKYKRNAMKRYQNCPTYETTEFIRTISRAHFSFHLPSLKCMSFLCMSPQRTLFTDREPCHTL